MEGHLESPDVVGQEVPVHALEGLSRISGARSCLCVAENARQSPRFSSPYIVSLLQSNRIFT